MGFITEEEQFKRLKELTGHAVVEVKRAKQSYGELIYVLTFDNGLHLTAEDGEYGDDAFRFLEEGDIKKRGQEKDGITYLEEVAS